MLRQRENLFLSVWSQIRGFHMSDKRGNSQSADKDQLLAHKSSPKDGHAFKLQSPQATGRRPLPSWSKASRRAINSRLY